MKGHTPALRRETQLPWSWPLAMWAISCMGPPLDKMSHSLLNRSSRRKSNSLCGETGNHTAVAALSTIPDGSPGSSMLFRVITCTSSSTLPTFSLFHLCTVDAHTPAQKLFVILWASFNMLLRPLAVIAVIFIGPSILIRLRTLDWIFLIKDYWISTSHKYISQDYRSDSLGGDEWMTRETLLSWKIIRNYFMRKLSCISCIYTIYSRKINN